jgi:hypothetical protein
LALDLTKDPKTESWNNFYFGDNFFLLLFETDFRNLRCDEKKNVFGGALAVRPSLK